MIKLPRLFEQKLADNSVLLAAVRSSLDIFEPWLEQSGMPFFPGFTDHSPRHVADVLDAAASLISDSARDLLSAEDVAVLCISILLHDCGMHLTQDSFRSLVSSDAPVVVSGLGDIPWPKIWRDFLGEANRFSQEKLHAIFGDNEPLIVANLDLNNIRERDCLLIGEFVRRHHTRLAHEIAVRGIGRSGGVPLTLAGLDSELSDIAGLVARSHGMSIRSTFDYITAKYGLVASYRNVKIPFLMAILRIADYIQVKSERAIRALLSVKELRSPVSRQEWLNHFAVRDVNTRHADPEALYVHATPSDAKTFLKLVALFADIQRELDESWGTLGEVYGRSGDLSHLGLTIRRIRSNLDSTEKFAGTVQYIPIKAKFDSSGSDLLKLLVGPLYDYRYGVGIRELLQNAIDASRELHDIDVARQHGSATVDVTVTLEENLDGTGRVTIVDRGVGMTLRTVVNYFLIAGASFRNSEVWKRQHLDSAGNARITRGGRFGVGALAAILLGDSINVKTRHISEPEDGGIEFQAKIDDPMIELRRCKAAVGTTITVHVTDSRVFKELRPRFGDILLDPTKDVKLTTWTAIDWFVQRSPK